MIFDDLSLRSKFAGGGSVVVFVIFVQLTLVYQGLPQTRSVEIFGSFIVFDMFLLAFLGREIDRRVISNIEQLAKDADQITTGDLNHDLRSVSGNDEIGQAVDSLQRMQQSLLDAISEAEHHQAYLQNVIESLPHPVHVIDAADYTIDLTNETTIVDGDDRCYEISHHVDSPCPAVDGTDWTCPIEQIRDAKSPHSTIHRHYEEGGEERIYQIHAAPLTNADGTVDKIVESHIDITERERTKYRLDRNNELLQVFDRVLRHNVNNSMNVIRGYAETMAAHDDDRIADWATKILESSDELLETIDKERRIAEGINEAVPTKPLAVEPMLARIQDRVEDQYSEATVDVIADDDTTINAVMTAEDAIEELIENAIIHSERSEPTVKVDCQRHADFLSITVSDNGPGLPAMEQNIIKKKQEIVPLFHGSGLGLWFVKIVAEQSNGEVRIIESNAHGTKMGVKFPTDGR